MHYIIGLTFGIYQTYITQRKINEYNNKIQKQWDNDLKNMKNEHRTQMEQFNMRYEKHIKRLKCIN
jgi:esterase/lipase